MTMTIASIVPASLVIVLLVLFAITRTAAAMIERRHPPAGSFALANETTMHHVHLKGPRDGALPPVVVIHGASGNLRDPMVPLRPLLEGKAEVLFLDRPGHGWSTRGPAENGTPFGQAKTIAALMDELGIGKAIIVGHSLGGAIAAALALDHPERVAGLVLASAATHPWPGGGTSWYYRLTAIPVIGRLFAETIACPAGLMRLDASTHCVFAPNRRPDTYNADAAIPLVLRPANFRHNAIDVENLYDHVAAAAPRYGEIKAPTVVISGNRDTVVYEEIHSLGLARDIPGAELVWIDNLGHKPDYAASDLIVAAIGRVAGAPPELIGDLGEIARETAARIAGDAYGPIEKCHAEKPPLAVEERV